MRVFRCVLAPVLLALAIIAAPAVSDAQIAIGINITIEPPELPVYDQPAIPGPGYIWTPGYWAWGDDGYYWVPGTWVEPPAVGVLWTPGYWGWRNGVYIWNAGYWGPHIGFYGGINYGFGYVGTGYLGGSWRGGVFAYNSAVNNFGGVHIINVYNQTVVNNTTITKVSFNGGPHGVAAQPNAQEVAAAHENHFQPTAMQTQNVTAASKNRAFLASVNQGKPAVAATSRPGQFSGPGVIAAHSGGNFHSGTNAPAGNIHGGTNAAITGKTNIGNPNAGTPPSNNRGSAPQSHPFNANAIQHNLPKGASNPPKPAPHPNVAHTPNKPPPKKDKKG
jgi:hypothetical protein